jgi:hypothetical protein
MGNHLGNSKAVYSCGTPNSLEISKVARCIPNARKPVIANNKKVKTKSESVGSIRLGLPHILNTPHFVSGIGALSAALNAKDKTRRVSPGAMMPSSQSRAVA